VTRKRTFSLPDELSSRLDEVADGNASAYVADAVRAKLERDAAAARIVAAYGQPDPGAYAYWLERLTQRPGLRAS
jgi:hypothetical protein